MWAALIQVLYNFKYRQQLHHSNTRALELSNYLWGNLNDYSGTPLNGHPSTADTYDITKNSESPDRFSLDILNSRHPATLYNGQ